MSEVLKRPAFVADLSGDAEPRTSALGSYAPTLVAVGGALGLALLRYAMGGASFISDGALMMLALAAYLIAAVFCLTNLYAPAELFQRIGLWGATVGVFFNLSSWIVRWFFAYDAETTVLAAQGVPAAEWPWLFRYIPFANLYDLSLAFAFTPQMAENAPIAKRAVGGYTFRLVDFEKVPQGHVLSVQRDPGATVVYLGFGLLGLTLCAVFFFSHQRVWALVEERGPGHHEVVLGGNTNRNKLGFEDRFKRIAAALGGQTVEVK